MKQDTLLQDQWDVPVDLYGEDLQDELTQFFNLHCDLIPTCREAFANYAYNQNCVAQEIVHPNGEIERLAPVEPDLSLLACDMSRFLYTVVSWYDLKNQQLARLHHNWESWVEGVFSCVERDEKHGETMYWTVRDFAEATGSVWSLQLEQGGGQYQHVTFSVGSEMLSGVREKTAHDGQRLLQKTYRTYCQRVSRILQLLQHLQVLGFRSVLEYKTWCARQGLSEEWLKSVQQRQQEQQLRRDSKKSDSDWFKTCVTRIYHGQATDEDLRTDYLRLIAGAFSGGLAGGARKAYLDLLLHAEQHANLFVLQPAIPNLGAQQGNTFVDGLAELARHYKHWIRSPLDWLPDTHDPRRQFSSLTRHVFTPYGLASFMDVAWFLGRSGRAQQQQRWFLHVASGQNIRTADIPVTFTKKMAHEFLQAPEHYTIEEALRWGQVIGQGGSVELLEAILGTFLGASFENEDFWSTVIQFMVANPILDPDDVSPVLDYIYNQKYVYREVINPGGEVIVLDPPEPKFSMKARSMVKLLDQVESWHQMLTREERAPKIEWEKSPISNFEFTEKDIQNGGALYWSIRELLSQKELKLEGRALHHCVASYAKNCKSGKTTVWSLQVTNSKNETLNLATIAIDPRTRRVTQLRSKYNIMPNPYSGGTMFRGGLEEGFVTYLMRARDILRMWARREQLGSKGGDLYAWIG